MMPFLITVVQMILLYVPTLSVSDLCFWGRTGLNTIVNGLYLHQGKRNEQPYFTLTSGCDVLYIYWTGSRLEISTNLNSGSSLYGYCSNGATNPNACNSWYIYNGGSFQIDPNVYIVSDSCPSWNCDQVSTPTLTNGCDGTFDQKIDVNAWKSSSNAMYWYFDPYHFNWICSDEYSMGSCSGQYYYAAAEDGWIDLAKGQSTQLDFVYPQNYTRTVHCIMNATPTPTNNPITSTTTDPTASPTNKPTAAQTDKPSTSPTINPTISPSDNPTTSTTINPTSAPTNNPTSSTTKSATVTTISSITSTTDTVPLSTTNNPITLTTINEAVSTTIDPHSSTINNSPSDDVTVTTNPISDLLIVPMKQESDNYAEEVASPTTTAHAELVEIPQIDHESEDGTFWTIFAVLISFIAACIITLCIVIIYKYKHNKAMIDIEMVQRAQSENMPKMPELNPVRINSNSQYFENNDDEKQGDETDINPNTNAKFGENKDEELTVSVDNKGTQSSHDHISFNVNMFTPGNHDNVAALIDDYTPNDGESDHEDIERITDDEVERNRGDTMGNNNNYNTNEDYDEVERDRGNTMGNNNCNDDKGKDLLKEWLEYKVKFPQYLDNFVENGYENLDIIKEITEKDELVEIGIVLKGHILKIMTEIKALNKNIVDQ